MTYYEIIVSYNMDYGEVIEFETDKIMNDSNDIVTYAIRKHLLAGECRTKVRWARAISEYEHEYVKPK